MIDYYFAGQASKIVSKYLLKINANILRSYYYDKKDLIQWYKRKWNKSYNGKIFVDSGAFSIHRIGGSIDVDEYICYLNKYHKFIDLYIQLDSIPGKFNSERTRQMILEAAEGTWHNYEYMYQRLQDPIKLCPVYHQEEPIEALYRFLNSDYDFNCICVSGRKDKSAKQRMSFYEQVVPIIRKIRPNVKIHGLGVGMVDECEQINFNSIDATSWLITAANGGIITPYGNILVSNQSKGKPDYIYNRSLSEIKIIEDFVRERGFDLKDGCESYEIRDMINISYLYNKSLLTEYKGNNLPRKGLW